MQQPTQRELENCIVLKWKLPNAGAAPRNFGALYFLALTEIKVAKLPARPGDRNKIAFFHPLLSTTSLASRKFDFTFLLIKLIILCYNPGSRQLSRRHSYVEFYVIYS